MPLSYAATRKIRSSILPSRLEALLVPDKGETTHKLAMRVAALCKIDKFENYSADKVFSICKKIYDYRSAVSHGRKPEKNRMIQVEEAKPLPTVTLGINILRHIIRSLCNHPKYLKPEELDAYLLSSSDASSGKGGSADASKPLE